MPAGTRNVFKWEEYSSVGRASSRAGPSNEGRRLVSSLAPPGCTATDIDRSPVAAHLVAGILLGHQEFGPAAGRMPARRQNQDRDRSPVAVRPIA
jgi:hypothetical protein